jgi:catechol 2,3-dioxygenase-like lactoylglutathione lyase family enzyme
MPTPPDQLGSVRYLVDDLDTTMVFYLDRLGFELRADARPAFAELVRGPLRLLLSGPASTAGRPMRDGRIPAPGGWNRIHLVVDDVDAEAHRLRAAGVTIRNDVVAGPGGRQLLIEDPAGNPVELFTRASLDRPDHRPGRGH